MFAKNGELVDELCRIKTQGADGDSVLDDLKLAAGSRDRPSKRAEMARPCKVLSATTSTAEFSVLLAKQVDFKNRRETLTVEIWCTPELPSKTKEFHEKLTERNRADNASKFCLKDDRNVLTVPICVWSRSRRSSLMLRRHIRA